MTETVTDHMARLIRENADLRARLAAVEAELAEMTAGYATQMETISRLITEMRANSAEFTRLVKFTDRQGQRLAEVEALCADEHAMTTLAEIRAAARGEGG